MSEEFTEKWAIITPENCQEINTMISGYKKQIEDLQGQLKEANDLIMWIVRTIPTDNKDEDDFDRYIEKWGVK